MKALTLLILSFITLVQLHAQNLVPNPGFEDYVNCPGNGVIKGPYYPATQTVSDWINPTRATPDYFACTGGLTGVPDNFLGKVPPHNGNAYAGIRAIFTDIGTRYEYLQVKLLQPLKRDTTYLVSCFVWCQFADSRGQNRALDRIQVAFTTSALTDNWAIILNAKSIDLQRLSKDFIMPAERWVNINGYYKAEGGEEWLTIGMFNEGLNYIKKIDQDSSGSDHCAYYTIDDVSVEATICDSVFNSSDIQLCDLNPQLNISTSAPAQSYKHMWNIGRQDISIQVTSPGVYWCTATNGCNIITDTFHVKIFTDTTVSNTGLILCDNIKTLTTPSEAKEYYWNTGERTRTIDIDKEGKYWRKSVNDCKLYIDSFYIVSAKHPGSYVKQMKDTISCGPYHLGEEYDGAPNTKWNTGDSGCCITISQTGIYTRTISEDGCPPFIDTVQITINNNCEYCLSVPSAFTPNHDGLNDLFRAMPSCPVNKFTFRIFNRWGQDVFYTTDPRQGWNGMHGADIADVGTYYYFVEYNTVYSSEMKMLKGDLLLIR